jgi:RNA polymerase-binding protein DksA
MKKKDLEKYEKLLLEKRAELLAEFTHLKKGSMDSTIKESSGDLSAYTYHMADLGTDSMEREKTFHFASKQGRLLYHIDEALRRIHNSTYGNCVECGQPISAERLTAVPHARMCIKCKEAEEQKKVK